MSINLIFMTSIGMLIMLTGCDVKETVKHATTPPPETLNTKKVPYLMDAANVYCNEFGMAYYIYKSSAAPVFKNANEVANCEEVKEMRTKIRTQQ